MADFGKALQRTLGFEGGYSDVKGDSGGKTRYGITEAEARAAGYTGDMRDFPVEGAKQIYRLRYWVPLMGDALFSQAIADEVFDTAVNCGIGAAIPILQRVLNAFNKGGKRWADVAEDGIMGKATIAAANAAQDPTLPAHVIPNIVKALNCEQGHYYILLRRSPSHMTDDHESFMDGWFRTRIALPG